MNTKKLLVALKELYNCMNQHEMITLELPERLCSKKDAHEIFKKAGYNYIVIKDTEDCLENIKIESAKVIK